MPYFFDKNKDINILFIHIPKTGGSSVENYFSKKFGIPLNNNSLYDFLSNYKGTPFLNKVSLQHQYLSNIMMSKRIVNDNLKIIAIVRNPYHRCVSDLFYLKLINKNSTKEEVFEKLRSYFFFKTFDNHQAPQYLYVCEKDDIPNNLIILRNESLDEDMKKLGYTDFNLRNNVNPVGNKINYMEYLNDNSIRCLNRVYEKDFKYFNYEMIKV